MSKRMQIQLIYIRNNDFMVFVRTNLLSRTSFQFYWSNVTGLEQQESRYSGFLI